MQSLPQVFLPSPVHLLSLLVLHDDFACFSIWYVQHMLPSLLYLFKLGSLPFFFFSGLGYKVRQLNHPCLLVLDCFPKNSVSRRVKPIWILPPW